MKIKLSDYLAKRLAEHYGVKKLFMVSGGGAMHLNNSFGRFIPYICNHHEQGAAIAAEGYARVNEKLAVVNVTTGPGGLNCLNGVFGQWTDSVPVLYISGQVKFSTCKASCPDLPLRQLGDQEVDIISVVKSLTKYAVMVSKPEEIKYHLDKAIYLATHGRKGPVWLDIPMNVQAAMIDDENLREFDVPCLPKADVSGPVSQLIEKINSAKRPLFVAGHGIRLSGQQANFGKLVNTLKIPSVVTFNGGDLLSTDNPCNVGKIGTIGQRAGNFALQNADLLVCFGTRNNIRQASYNWENYGKKAFKVVIDIDSAELSKPLVRPDLSICADLSDIIPELLSACVDKSLHEFSNKGWLNYCNDVKSKFDFEHTKEYQQDFNGLINPYYFTKVLTSRLKKDDTLVSANATPSICIFQAGEYHGQRVIMNSGDASMGYGLPCSLGAALETKGRTVCCEGDGSIMMNIQELQTIGFNKIPVKIFVYKNDGYSSIRQSQKNFFNGNMTGSGPTSGVSVPDFTKVAEAFGIKSLSIKKASEIPAALDEVFSSDEPILCEVQTEVDYTFTPKLSARTLPDGTMVSPSLEDMFPFIDREEFELLMK